MSSQDQSSRSFYSSEDKAPPTTSATYKSQGVQYNPHAEGGTMIEVVLNDRLGVKIRVKCK